MRKRSLYSENDIDRVLTILLHFADGAVALTLDWQLAFVGADGVIDGSVRTRLSGSIVVDALHVV